MSQTIRRKATSARKVASAQGKKRKVKQAKATTGSVLDAVMAWLPFSEDQLQRVFLAAMLGGAAVLAWVVASMAGVPAMAQQQLALIAGDAGFQVVHVEVRGVKNLNELKVYERALAERNRAMPLVDLQALRNELLELSWVKDARVSRQLPDTLVIDIVEREPHAVLRKADRFVLIDETGHELEPISRKAAEGRLIVSGPGAGQQVVGLASLLEAAPALQPRVREAEWIGNRRWNLTFQTGQVLALPEGARESAGALVSFARLDGTNRLLGGKVAAFDMRARDRIYLRIPGREDEEAVVNAGAVRKPPEEIE
ncbi:cell division protein FtsQ/DivIB [Novosphingobium album (ex Liu et al. 2023)]|uniref:Cell division protein FtsQ n=1 Tax=Novosphingobium album (ex Liu et al. 2023) TaxID=3031130 RepID=A0ABT5WK49_9SPHN|nr:FtsQ-type POTRA domain-containing protein [Novosphingobium album (ex Liu et al. 2023)]MDE8650401.1 FtsQ-type POTRA domain-containing protein [Novosphingobium album (ex Liu et al. 2023)]